MLCDLFEGDVLTEDCANVVPDLSRLLSDDELTKILPEGAPYREAVILDGEELTPDMALIIASMNWETMMRNTAAYLATDWYYYVTNPDYEHDYNRPREIKQLADVMLVLARKGSVEVKATLAQVWHMPGAVFDALIVAPDADVACALVRNKTVSGEDLGRAVKYGGSAACRVAVCERAADLTDEILRSVADEKIFAMCRGVTVDADVVEAARVELERRRTDVGE
jgi:uncharacterized protein (DUF2336 family)